MSGPDDDDGEDLHLDSIQVYKVDECPDCVFHHEPQSVCFLTGETVARQVPDDCPLQEAPLLVMLAEQKRKGLVN